MTIIISIDCMGGDHGPSVTVPAAIRFADDEPNAELVLVGHEQAIRSKLKEGRAETHPRIRVIHAAEVVAMDDPIEVALRRKKDSSMRVAITQVKEGRAQACVSAGNTGALMAVSRYLLKTIPGVDRPAICTILPNQKDGPTYMLDLGANVDCEAQHLHQFALMGSALVAAVEGKPKPLVGLLNVGEEDIKGNEVVKEASELFKTSGLNFVGNVEGNDIYKGVVDVVACDGFTGNVALKASEGLAKMLIQFLREEFKRTWWSKVLAVFAWPVLARFKKRMDPRRYNGATLLGLRGIVIKSHGSADEVAFLWALRQAEEEARAGVIQRITDKVQSQMAALGNEGVAPENI